MDAEAWSTGKHFTRISLCDTVATHKAGRVSDLVRNQLPQLLDCKIMQCICTWIFLKPHRSNLIKQFFKLHLLITITIVYFFNYIMIILHYNCNVCISIQLCLVCVSSKHTHTHTQSIKTITINPKGRFILAIIYWTDNKRVQYFILILLTLYLTSHCT